MPRRYDILVIDLDGTLLGIDGHVSERNRAAVEAARDAGMTVVLATGRAYVESMRAIRQIGHAGPVIAAGGSILCDGATGRTLERRVMDRAVVEHAAAVFQDHGHRSLVLKDGDVVGYDYLIVGEGRLDAASEWWFRAHAVSVRHAGHWDDDPHPEESLRVGAVAGAAEIAPIADHLRESLGDRAFLQHWPAVTETHPTGGSTHLLEIFDRNVNKWTMLERLCRREGLDPTSVVAIGDGLNDVEMVTHAALGVAMANAFESVREAADRHTGHHDEDGVAEAIGMILKGAW